MLEQPPPKGLGFGPHILNIILDDAQKIVDSIIRIVKAIGCNQQGIQQDAWILTMHQLHRMTQCGKWTQTHQTHSNPQHKSGFYQDMHQSHSSIGCQNYVKIIQSVFFSQNFFQNIYPSQYQDSFQKIMNLPNPKKFEYW